METIASTVNVICQPSMETIASGTRTVICLCQASMETIASTVNVM